MAISRLVGLGLGFFAAVGFAQSKYPDNDLLSKCPGYKASNVKTTSNGLTADLTLSGKACNAYGSDLENLRLQVKYETG